MNLAHLLAQAARTHPERTAVAVDDARYLDYRGFDAAARALGCALGTRLGVERGARVAIAADNHRDYLSAMWGTWYAGGCAVPVNAKLHPKELAYIFGNCAPAVVFASASTGEAAASALSDTGLACRLVELGSSEFAALAAGPPTEAPECAPDEPAWIFYTSGTTGRPKGATLTHGNMLGATLRYYADVDFVDETDVMLHVAPLSHGSGIYALPMIAKAAAQIVPASGKFDADEAMALVARYRKVTTFLAPTMVNRLARHPAAAALPAGHWNTIFYGGAPMYLEDIKRALAAFGPVFWQGYGQGESPCTIASLTKRMHADTAHPRFEARLQSTGIPRLGVEVRVVDDRGATLPDGETGEVVVRSEVTMAGYWRNEEATREAIRDGWLHTGDIGVFSDDGFLTLKDRAKDLIIAGGSNIYPREIEEVLLQDARIVEACVVGAHDPEWGEVPVAFVVVRPGALVSVEELDARCLANIARFKRPKGYRFVTELPKSHYGKVLKSALRDALSRGTR